MGFQSGFSSLTKYKDTTINEAISIDRLSRSFVDYNDFDPQFIEKLEYYRQNREGDCDELVKTLSMWFSAGKRYLDEYIVSKLRPVFKDDESAYYGVDARFIQEGIVWASNELQKTTIFPIEIIKAYTDGKNKIDTLFRCEGLEVLDEHGNRRFLDCKDNYFFIAEKGYDEDCAYVLNSFIKTLKKISSLDLDKTLIWYYRSY